MATTLYTHPCYRLKGGGGRALGKCEKKSINDPNRNTSKRHLVNQPKVVGLMDRSKNTSGKVPTASNISANKKFWGTTKAVRVCGVLDKSKKIIDKQPNATRIPDKRKLIPKPSSACILYKSKRCPGKEHSSIRGDDRRMLVNKSKMIPKTNPPPPHIKKACVPKQKEILPDENLDVSLKCTLTKMPPFRFRDFVHQLVTAPKLFDCESYAKNAVMLPIRQPGGRARLDSEDHWDNVGLFTKGLHPDYAESLAGPKIITFQRPHSVTEKLQNLRESAMERLSIPTTSKEPPSIPIPPIEIQPKEEEEEEEVEEKEKLWPLKSRRCRPSQNLGGSFILSAGQLPRAGNYPRQANRGFNRNARIPKRVFIKLRQGNLCQNE